MVRAIHQAAPCSTAVCARAGSVVSAVVVRAGLQQVSLMSLGQLTNTGVLPLGTLPGLRRITLSRCPHVCKTGLEVGSPSTDEFVGPLRLSLPLYLVTPASGFAELRREVLNFLAREVASPVYLGCPMLMLAVLAMQPGVAVSALFTIGTGPWCHFRACSCKVGSAHVSHAPRMVRPPCYVLGFLSGSGLCADAWTLG